MTKKRVGRPLIGTDRKQSYNTKISPESKAFLDSLPRGRKAGFVEDALQEAIAKYNIINSSSTQLSHET